MLDSSTPSYHFHSLGYQATSMPFFRPILASPIEITHWKEKSHRFACSLENDHRLICTERLSSNAVNFVVAKQRDRQMAERNNSCAVRHGETELFALTRSVTWKWTARVEERLFPLGRSSGRLIVSDWSKRVYLFRHCLLSLPLKRNERQRACCACWKDTKRK